AINLPGNEEVEKKVTVVYDLTKMTATTALSKDKVRVEKGEVKVATSEEITVEFKMPKLSFTKRAITESGDNVAEPGELVTYTIKVENRGTGKAINVTVTDNLKNVINKAGNQILDLTTVKVTAPGTVKDGIVSLIIPEILPETTYTIVITAKMLDPYPAETLAGETIKNIAIVNGVQTPECPIDDDGNSLEGFDSEKCGPIVIPEAKPLLLRNDVFSINNIEEFDPEKLPSAAEKNSALPVVTAGENVFYFITLTNDNSTAVKVPIDKRTVTSDYVEQKDSLGNPAFTDFEFEGIIFKNNKTNVIKFLSTKEVEKLVEFLSVNNFQGTAIEINKFDFKVVLPNSSITFVIRARINPNGAFLPSTPVAKAISIEKADISNFTAANGIIGSATTEVKGIGSTQGTIESYTSLIEDDPKVFTGDDLELRRAVFKAETASGDLIISKSTEKETVSVGQFVPYTIEITNRNSRAVNNVYIEDKIPAGFIFVEGSARSFINGELDGKGTSVATTGLKTVKIGPFDIPAKTEKARITYLLKVGVGVTTGTYKNRAVAAKDGPISNESVAEVRVVPDPLFDETIIIGKVFHDKNENGIQEEEFGELGLPGVRVVTVDGINAVTDAHGRYHIPEITDEKGKNFILKVDPITLPKNTIFTTENPLVKRLGKVMMRYNFGVKFPEKKVIDNGTALIIKLKEPLFNAGTTELKQPEKIIEVVMSKLKSAEKPYSKIIVVTYQNKDIKIHSGKDVKAVSVDTNHKLATKLSIDRAKAVAELLREKVEIPVNLK
ncbi:MAG: hypothetical protein ACRC4Z_01935, partial [Fusobacteriaceae bacterium]